MLSLLATYFIFLVTVQWNTCFSADAIVVADPLAARVAAITGRMAGLIARGYDAEADRLVRLTTTETFACVERGLSAGENAALVDAFLKAELFQHFNTEFSDQREHDHRIVYDFLSKLDKARVVSLQEKNNLTKFTVLSLAAQAFFWNSKLTVEELRTQVRRELDFGLFRRADHPLNVSASIHLTDAELAPIIQEIVTVELRANLNALLDQFNESAIGDTYTALLANLTAEQGRRVYAPLELAGIPRDAEFGGVDGVRAAFYPSSGLGVQCGFNSLFIPTETAVLGSAPGTAREKVTQSLVDSIHDPVLRRLYTYESPFSDSSIMNDGNIFDQLIERQQLLADGDTHEKEQAAINVERLKKARDKYRLDKLELDGKRKKASDAGVAELFRAIRDLQDNILDQFETVMSVISVVREEWGNRQSPHHKDYLDLLGYIKDLKIGAVPVEDFFNDEYLKQHVTFEFFACICRLAGEGLLAAHIADLTENYRNAVSRIDEEGRTQERTYLNDLIVPLMEEIEPTVISDEDLIENMQFKAKAEEIDGYLQCRSAYTQLWAMKNNYNIYVFSSVEVFGQPPVDVIVRSPEEPYSNSFMYYPNKFAGRKLATVILTSPTAKNLFLTKSPGHYDKFIVENDLSAIAKQIRQARLMTSLTALLPSFKTSGRPGRKVFDANAFLAALAKQASV